MLTVLIGIIIALLIILVVVVALVFYMRNSQRVQKFAEDKSNPAQENPPHEHPYRHQNSAQRLNPADIDFQDGMENEIVAPPREELQQLNRSQRRRQNNNLRLPDISDLVGNQNNRNSP